MAQTQIQTQLEQPKGQIVFLSALPLNSLPRSVLNITITPVSLRDLADWVKRKAAQGYAIVHYIRHGATIATLRSLGIPLDEQPNSGLYRYQQGDIVVVVSLRTPPRGQDVAEVSINDLEAWVVFVS